MFGSLRDCPMVHLPRGPRDHSLNTNPQKGPSDLLGNGELHSLQLCDIGHLLMADWTEYFWRIQSRRGKMQKQLMNIAAAPESPNIVWV